MTLALRILKAGVWQELIHQRRKEEGQQKNMPFGKEGYVISWAEDIAQTNEMCLSEQTGPSLEGRGPQQEFVWCEPQRGF